MDNQDQLERCAFDQSSLEALKTAADLPTKHSRSGRPTLAWRGLRLHSSIDPDAEAAALIESSLALLRNDFDRASRQDSVIVILGAGLGYQAAVLAKSLQEPLPQIICVEVEESVAKKAIQLAVWQDINLNVKWITGQNCEVSLRRLMTAKTRIILDGSASYRMNKPRYDVMRGMLTGSAVPERPMRVLIPTPLYGGSLPVARHCAEAVRELGYDVELLDLSTYHPLYERIDQLTKREPHRRSLQGMMTAFLAEVVVARALDWKADLIWAVAQSPLTPTALEELRREGVCTALWFVEDYQVFSYWKQLAPAFDAVFTIQRGPFHEELKRLGVPLVEYLPCAANPRLHFPQELTAEEKNHYGSEVSFVGAGYYNRQQTFARLRLENFKIWGNDWPEGSPCARWVQDGQRRISTAETAKIYSASAVNLNLHSSQNHPGVNPHGDFVNPRTFEIAACGGFQLVDHRSELPELLKPGREVVTFESVDEIPALLNRYASDPDARAQIAESARARVLREHTYSHRMRQALQSLENKFPRLKARKRGPNYVSSLIEAAGDDAELIDFLHRFNPEDEVDLDTIVSRIETGKGNLSRPEALFLLMKEFRDWGREKGVIS